MNSPLINFSLINLSSLNTFAFQRLVCEGKNELFLLENALILTHEFLYDNFNTNILVKKRRESVRNVLSMINFFPQTIFCVIKQSLNAGEGFVLHFMYVKKYFI